MTTARQRPRPGFRSLAVASLAAGVVGCAGLAFVYKMTEFAMTVVDGDVSGFGVTAVATYLTGMLPLLLLTLWAVLSGRFRDIERPKLRLFELHDQIERGGDVGAGGSSRG